MKTIDLSSEAVSAAEIFEMARKDSLLVKTEKGDSFLVSQADEFATEVELLRCNPVLFGIVFARKDQAAFRSSWQASTLTG